MLLPYWCVCIALLSCVNAWSQEEMDIYDLVEEIGQQTTFYDILQISKNATSMEVRRAFRQLSLIHHPDKSDEEDAENRFRQMAGVYEVLRSEELRRVYDEFLEKGMPDWRSAMFYYRRVRKMGLLEIAVILSVIVTVGQYLTAWAGYHDRRLNVEEQLRFKTRKGKMSSSEFDSLVREHMEQFRPSWYNTLPYQLARGTRWLCVSAPGLLASCARHQLNQRREQQEAEAAAAAEAEELVAEAERQRQRRRQGKERRRQRVAEQQQLQSPAPGSWEEGAGAAGGDVAEVWWSTERSGVWTDDDLVELARLVKKYPGGVPDRWELVAQTMQRTLAEVTAMAHKIKERPQLVPVSGGAQSTCLSQPDEDGDELSARAKLKTRADEPTMAAGADALWSQKQQRALELALAQYAKGSAERWERIAKLVPDKNKEECMLRFRHLSEVLKKKKQEVAAEREQEDGGAEDAQERVESAPDSVRCRTAVTSCS